MSSGPRWDFSTSSTRRALTARQRRIRIALVCTLLSALSLVSATSNRTARLVLWNDTPSEPTGLYIRTAAEPKLGEMAAFMAPSPAMAYVAQHLSLLQHRPILKVLAAGPGAVVCTTSGRLVIDGRETGRVAAHDRHGHLLPAWRGCRRLGAGEWFAYSGRTPNSFDSRYYGPIRSTQVMAIYAPLWTDRSPAR